MAQLRLWMTIYKNIFLTDHRFKIIIIIRWWALHIPLPIHNTSWKCVSETLEIFLDDTFDLIVSVWGNVPCCRAWTDAQSSVITAARYHIRHNWIVVKPVLTVTFVNQPPHLKVSSLWCKMCILIFNWYLWCSPLQRSVPLLSAYKRFQCIKLIHTTDCFENTLKANVMILSDKLCLLNKQCSNRSGFILVLHV